MVYKKQNIKAVQLTLDKREEIKVKIQQTHEIFKNKKKDSNYGRNLIKERHTPVKM